MDKVRAPKPEGLGLTGEGVTVAVIDSGLDATHPDLQGDQGQPEGRPSA